MNSIEKKYFFDKEKFLELKTQYIKGLLAIDRIKIREKIKEPLKEDILDFTKIKKDEYAKLFEIGLENLKNKKVGVVIVNGGMATRFGSKVKGIVKVFDDYSFLELKIRHIKYISKIYSTQIPIFIMNSFATSEKTIKHLEKNKYFGYEKELIKCFNQNIFRRLNIDGTEYKGKISDRYYGPGHGDFFYTFKTSGMLNYFKNNEGKILLYSNVDNLGATIEPAIIGYHIKNNFEMIVELARKNKGDKGGAPALVNGKLQIVEDFKFPDTFNQNRIKIFNTANYVLSTKIFDYDINLPWYVVYKKVNNRTVVQFEHLMGDLTMFINKCGYIIIDRKKRFIPIKVFEDLEKNRRYLKKLLGKIIC
ncbi:MAG TPA: UTP--glucose-1-phosphate uridylyltransferase [bacterium]|nr:UTP--glucose-1-phosphate uridylyltransferase [bacterium]HOL46911.1 UTP--glucose-1-phosphate uridylyltransferase [bacterium]HPQ18327.1 UTP--glucose-1-phosphate uridylyltransferase [bacterium]